MGSRHRHLFKLGEYGFRLLYQTIETMLMYGLELINGQVQYYVKLLKLLVISRSTEAYDEMPRNGFVQLDMYANTLTQIYKKYLQCIIFYIMTKYKTYI